MYAYAPLIGFRSEKAAQICAFFLLLSGGAIEKLKLIKLVYLSERESVSRRRRPIVFDEYYSLKNGPICSNTLNGIDGGLDQPIWGKYLQKDGRKDIYIAAGVALDGLDQISNGDIDILNSIWKQFGWMTSSQIRNWTHKNCKEYVEVEKGRLPIMLNEMASAIGLEDTAEPDKIVSEYRNLQSVFS
jgi:uncharacterized phage-associated protein